MLLRYLTDWKVFVLAMERRDFFPQVVVQARTQDIIA